MSDDERALLAINRETFEAERHEPSDRWMDVLHHALSDDFRLRRAIGEIEDRERMIARLSRTAPAKREVLGEDVAVLGESGIVRSRIRMAENTFQNVKLFERRPDGWLCVYWRVSRMPS